MGSTQPDVLVIGGGAAGLGAALHARRAGAEVLLVERDRLGGDCTWTGCVPSKTLIDSARRAHLSGGGDARDPVDALARARAVVHEIAAEEDAEALATMGITVLDGHARFVDRRRVDVDGVRLRPATTIIATGSAPLVPSIPGLAAAAPLTTEDVFTLERLPDRLAIIGAGPVGLELGQASARLGTAVTLVDAAPRVAPGEEPETSTTLRRVLRREGVEIRTGVTVDRVTADPAARGVGLHAQGSVVAAADRVLVAVGRRPVTDGLDLRRAGIQVTHAGAIPVDRRMRTAAPGVLAVGDVTTFPRLTHAAYRMGQIAAHTALRRSPWRFSPGTLPWAIFTDPEVGRVGLTEAQAYDRYGPRARVVVFPVRKTDRARTAGVRDGVVKLIAAPHPVTRDLLGGRLVGATVVAPSGGDVIGELALAVRSRTPLLRLAQTVHAYPTWSFAVWEAVSRFFGPHKSGRARPARPG